MSDTLFAEVESTYYRHATLSACGTYRLTLSRVWDAGLPALGWLMLNPSTADGLKDDATIRKCVGFAKQWNYGGIEVRNLFTFRSTDPRRLATAEKPIGPDADRAILDLFGACPDVIAAWGGRGGYLGRDGEVLRIIRQNGFADRLLCLGMTQFGQPRHPLYLAAALKPMPFPWYLERFGPATAGGSHV